MRWLQYLALPLILFALWAGLSYTGRVPAILLPTPGAVWDSFVSLTVSGDLLYHTLASGFRSLALVCRQFLNIWKIRWSVLPVIHIRYLVSRE